MKKQILATLCAAFLLGGCTMTTTEKSTATGAAIGTLAGAGIAAAAGGSGWTGAAVGAAAGGITGYFVGEKKTQQGQ